MGLIQNVKERFNTLEAFNVFSDCMYMPTWADFSKRAMGYIKENTINIFGFMENNNIVGLIVVDLHKDKTADIKGIAVGSDNRKQSIGNQLIQYVCKELSVSVLHSETDDDAVGFYEKCGFNTEKFIRNRENGEYIRHRCVLRIN